MARTISAETGREYRGYSNINWGQRFNPETGAHHCRAEDAESALRTLRSGIGYPNMQVRLGDGWHWVTATPVHLGGISRHWHGERV